MLDLLYLIPVALAFTPQMLWYGANLESRIAKRGIDIQVPAGKLYQQGILASLFALLIAGVMNYPLATASGIAVAVSASLLASHIDWKTCRIPNELVAYGFIGSSLVVPMFYNPDGWINIGVTTLILIVAGVITNLITKGKLGGGDIKLLISFTPALYWFDSVNIFFVLILAFPIQLVARKIWRKNNPDAIGAPYGPALTIAFILVICYGALTSTPII